MKPRDVNDCIETSRIADALFRAITMDLYYPSFWFTSGLKHL